MRGDTADIITRARYVRDWLGGGFGVSAICYAQLGDFPIFRFRAWNALPSSVRFAPSLLQFRRDLKTALHVSVIVLFAIVFGCVQGRIKHLVGPTHFTMPGPQSLC